MIYLSSFLFSDEKVIDPNIYPYNVFADKAERLLLFAPITVLYGENASGKSTMLNIMANKLRLEGLEYATSNQYGRVPYFLNFIKGCSYALGEEENGKALRRIMPKSYILVPGYGAQGGKGADLVHYFNQDGLGAIVNSSRGIIAAYKQEQYAQFSPENYADASRQAVLDMIADIQEALEKAQA